MYRILIITFFAFFCLANCSTENQIFVESLAANIENEGLLTNFPQAWRRHIDAWRQAPNDTASVSGNFKCNVSASSGERERTVNRLHPRQVGVVAALGASFVAGLGADARQLMEMTVEYRGVSFAIGGDGSLNDTVTLPNILKNYNPNLRGYSLRISPAWFEELSRFNLAVPGATSRDLEDQAKELIKRIDKWPGAKDQWKVVTIYIGMNDLCEACDKRIGGRASSYSRQIEGALDKLQKGLTRTVVNLVALPPMNQWYKQLHDDQVCTALHRYLCPCIFNVKTDALAAEYNAELYRLAPKYTGVDFSVVVQPFMSGPLQLPKVTVDGNERTDQALFAPDCFHFSRKGHAAAARSLWQNMFQAVGEKTLTLGFSDDEISCPDESFPYIRTALNTYDWSSAKGRLSTIHGALENLTSDFWDKVVNVTVPYPQVNISFDNNVTFTLKPWHRNLIRLAQIPTFDSSSISTSGAAAAWIGFGVILALAVVATAIVGYVDLKKRQRRYRGGERQPLLTGSNNVEPAF